MKSLFVLSYQKFNELDASLFDSISGFSSLLPLLKWTRNNISALWHLILFSPRECDVWELFERYCLSKHVQCITRLFFSARMHSDHTDWFINLFILSTSIVEVNNFFSRLPARRSQMYTQVWLVRTIAKKRWIPKRHLTKLHNLTDAACQ